MQPILAESVPRRGRTVVLALVLALIAGFAINSTRNHPTHYRKHHAFKRIGKCPQSQHSVSHSYVYKHAH